jgi:hypothetical protein
VRPRGALVAVAALSLLAGAGSLGGCGIGEGKGEVKGTLHINGCFGEGTDLSNQKAFDLHPSFFAGEPIDDPANERRMDQLRLRVQSSGANVETADALVVEVTDVAQVAARLGQWMDVYAAGDATPAGGTELVGPVRASLNLLRTCGKLFPAVQQWSLVADTDTDYAATGIHSKIRFTQLGGRECVVDETGVHDCEATDGGAYSVGFGGNIRAEFDLHVVDPRPKYLGPEYPALGGGHIVGYFEFTLRRGRVAQAFP